MYCFKWLFYCRCYVDHTYSFIIDLKYCNKDDLVEFLVGYSV